METSSDKRILRLERVIVAMVPYLAGDIVDSFGVDRPAAEIEAARLSALKHLLWQITQDVLERTP